MKNVSQWGAKNLTESIEDQEKEIKELSNAQSVSLEVD